MTSMMTNNDDDDIDTISHHYTSMMNQIKKRLVEKIGGEIPILFDDDDDDDDDVHDVETMMRNYIQSLTTTTMTEKTTTAHNSNATDTLLLLLMQYVVLKQATPQRLAEYIVHGSSVESVGSDSDIITITTPEGRRRLIDVKLLEDTHLLQQILLADGPNNNNYGRCIEILNEIRQIQHDEEQAEEHDTKHHRPAAVLGRLAIAIALEHATPVPQSNPKNDSDADADGVDDNNNNNTFVVDPIARYLNYMNAYLEGELDPCFGDLTVWELRFVVDGDEPDTTAAWGRQMLRSYRPDHILTQDDHVRIYPALRGFY
jgi:hypothetical protein